MLADFIDTSEIVVHRLKSQTKPDFTEWLKLTTDWSSLNP